MDRFVRANNIQLHYLDHQGSDPPLVLMPGLTANASSFDGLIKAGLSPALRVLALDLRGRGLSQKPDSGYSMADHAADVLGLLDALELRQVVLGGHSFGGLLSIYMAAQNPERVSKLVIIDAAGSMHPQVRELIKPSVDRLGKVLPSWEAYLEAMKQMPFYQGWWDPAIESYYRADVEIRSDGTVKPRSRPEAIIEAVDKSLAEDWAQHLKAVRQPVLLLNAPGPYGPPGTPPVLPREQAMDTVNMLSDGRYVEIPGNHMTMLFGEGAQRIVEAVLDFVRR
ncbi:MAG TPA: alpha/beta hydrolase [Desulfomonilia bacterium]|nr:alpha/beta hydrolase [Desulfomonilia bacterium]